MRRIVCVWFPRLAMDRLSRRRPAAWRDRPRALTAEAAGRMFVAAPNRAAECQGVAGGMTLADARALVPALATTPADPAADARLLDAVARWCDRYTPWVATHGGDGLWLDVSGCAHLMGGEAALMADLGARLAGFGLTARLALAGTAGAAWAVARFGTSGTIVAAGKERPALAPLPVAALRLAPPTCAALARLGLRRIGDLAQLPRASLAVRFGRDLVLRLDQAWGEAGEAISPRPPERPWRVRLDFAEPIGAPHSIVAALDRLLDDLCRQLAEARCGVRRLELTALRVDGARPSVAVGTARPVNRAVHLRRLFAEKIQTIDPGFGIEAMILEAPVVEAAPPQQQGMSAERQAGRGDLAALVDGLGNRLGFERVVRFAAVSGHLPDRAAPARPALMVEGRPRWAPRTLRPVRLLRRPEPVAVLVAGTHADPADPPPRFRWRGTVHRLAAAEGPERIAPQWWHPDPSWRGALRDYWQVEDETGQRLWIYREAPPPADGAGWYVHGLL